MKTEKNKSRKNIIERFTKTRKNNKTPINGRVLEKEKEGWKIVEVFGEPFEMGYAHGYLLHDELREIKKTFPFIVKNELKISFSPYVEKSNVLIKPVLKTKYPDLYQEIRGISQGAKKRGLDISVDFLISWNAYMSLQSVFLDDSIETENNNAEKVHRCSAFIATGNATKNGDIVMAHNTHTHFAEGRFMNIVMYLKPSRGIPFMMQMAAGFIASVTDWFLTEAGIIGCETTIAYTNYKPSFGSPFFCRIREAMQYGNSLDQYVDIMLKDNAGDYACSWQFGNVNTGEIMLFELGLEHYNVQRTKNGVYYGMNSAIDYHLRSRETEDNSIFDPTRPTGSRNYRLHHLLNEKYYGKITTDNAKVILSDHYDMSLLRTQMNGRSICKHREHVPPIEGQKVKPVGAVDGKVVNSKMAKKMEFLARFGCSCGRDFRKSDFLKKHPEYEKWRPYLVDFPKTEWTRIGI